MTEKNWAGNHTYEAAALVRPESIEQVQEIVAREDKLKVLGTRHCFNDIADFPEGVLISLARLDKMEMDRANRTVTVEGGVRYGELCEYLNREGFAVHNLASLPHITVVGACATATHGSGDGNGNLATPVSALEIVTANGEIVTLTRAGDKERFQGAVVGLGALGAVTKLTLDVLPAFDMRQCVYQDLPFAEVQRNFDEITSSAYSVSLFTAWRNGIFDQVWLKSKVADGEKSECASEFFGAQAAQGPMHPVPGNDPINCTDQLGVPGPWNERLPHFKYGFRPSNGDELQSEFFVARENAVDALSALHEIGEKIAELVWISEIRTIDADDFWMSPCYKQRSVAIHFTWKNRWAEVRNLLPAIEEKLAPWNARPHWGKLFTMESNRLQSLYPKLPDFRELANGYDRAGKFLNPYLREHIW